MATDTLRFEFQDRNQRENLTVSITIENDSNVPQVTGGTMTHRSFGRYTYDFAASTSGWYTAKITVGTFSTVQSKEATVVTTTVSTTASDIASTQELAQFIGMEGVVPDRTIIGESRNRENVGTGDNSTTEFFLDRAGVIASTYTFAYGPSESSLTAMTETTDYTVDKDLGKFTLTATGVTGVGTANIYGSYSFLKSSHGMVITDTMLQAAIDRAQSEIERFTNNRWTDGTDATPNYAQVTNEKQDGKGDFDRNYYLFNFPLPDVSATLVGNIGTANTTITVDSTNGFLSTGTLGIDTEKLTYTGKTSTTFTGVTRGVDDTTAASHGTSVVIYPYVFEISTTSKGTEPVYQMLDRGSEYDLELETGRVHVFNTDIVLDTLTNRSPPLLTPNRFRSSYIWGTDSIPAEIKRLVLMVAAKDIMHKTMRKTNIDGIEHGQRIRELFDIDEEWIKRTMEDYHNINVRNI
jgi:hypothetical protein